MTYLQDKTKKIYKTGAYACDELFELSAMGIIGFGLATSYALRDFFPEEQGEAQDDTGLARIIEKPNVTFLKPLLNEQPPLKNHAAFNSPAGSTAILSAVAKARRTLREGDASQYKPATNSLAYFPVVHPASDDVK